MSLVDEKLEKHDTLNPKIFGGDSKLLPEVREALLNIANEFVETLKNDDITINVKDIKIVGSNCSYNYTDKSDIDLHIVAETSTLDCPANLYPLIYSAYRSIFNDKYDFTLHGVPVEIFVETDTELDKTPRSNGVYSVMNDEWIKEPVQEDIPELDEEKFDKLFTEWEDKYFDILDTSDPEIVNDFIEDIYDLRKSSIAQEGEYGYGNQVFKEFRNFGYMDNLRELKTKLITDKLSIQ